MSKERRLNVRTKLDCFYFPNHEVEELIDKPKSSTLYKETPQNGNNTVIKMLDSLRLSSYEHKLSSSVANIPPKIANTKEEYLLTRTRTDQKDKAKSQNDSSEDITVNGGELKALGNMCPRRTFDVETSDSLSDSAYSQSSDVSRESDNCSLNTLSSDSSDLFVYRQIMKSERGERGCNTVTMHTAYGFCIDIDVEVTKTVVMLMKIILWLRQKEERKIPSSLKQLKFSNLTTYNEERLMAFDTRQPKSPKRISFSPWTLLMNAVNEQSYNEAKNILESSDNIDVNAKTPSGQSLIHIAAGNADLKCLQLLLKHGANPKIKDGHGWGPLHAAIRKGKWKCAILLIEAGADFAEYSTQRIQEYNDVLCMSRTCYKSMEIFV